MNVRDVMEPSPGSCSEHSTLREVARIMLETDAKVLPILEEGRSRLKGVVRSKDVISKCMKEHKDPVTTPVSEVMTSPTFSVREETPWGQCQELMKNNLLDCLPVTDRNGHFLGFVYSEGEGAGIVAQPQEIPSPRI